MSATRFWRALVGGCVVIVVSALLNTVIDPLGQIGLIRPHRWNLTMPSSTVQTIREQQDVSAYRRIIATTGADTFLIGTSREARGFDLCDRPNVLRIAGSGWGMREIAAVQRHILETRVRPATLLIELGVAINSSVAVQRGDYRAIRAAIAPATTVISLRTIAHNLGTSDENAAYEAMCRPSETAPVDWNMAAAGFQRVFQTGVDVGARARGREMLKHMMADASLLCARTRLRHSIIFFALPGLPPSRLARQHEVALRAERRQDARAIDDFAEASECRIRFIDLSSTPPGSTDLRSPWQDRSNWLDYTHFSPALGRLAIDALTSPTTKKSVR